MLGVRLTRSRQLEGGSKAFLSETTREELVHMCCVESVSSKLQIGRVLENLLGLCLHEW